MSCNTLAKPMFLRIGLVVLDFFVLLLLLFRDSSIVFHFNINGVTSLNNLRSILVFLVR